MEESVFVHKGSSWRVTNEMKDAFRDNGFVLVRSLLSQEEILKVKTYVEKHRVFQDQHHTREDGHGGRTCATLWTHPLKGVMGVLATMERIAGTMQEVNHTYHLYTLPRSAHNINIHTGTVYTRLCALLVHVPPCKQHLRHLASKGRTVYIYEVLVFA
ncbi:hypothetical protein SK128_006742 [Halocaridina rubra]|uniref:Phytanoyl-CoA dioxygenase n=1 Tax=Halocaridina rubra TaxID=373956 RepID=A0AAN8WR60_HALRR